MTQILGAKGGKFVVDSPETSIEVPTACNSLFTHAAPDHKKPAPIVVLTRPGDRGKEYLTWSFKDVIVTGGPVSPVESLPDDKRPAPVAVPPVDRPAHGDEKYLQWSLKDVIITGVSVAPVKSSDDLLSLRFFPIKPFKPIYPFYGLERGFITPQTWSPVEGRGPETQVPQASPPSGGVGFPLGPGTYTVVDGILEVTTARDTATIGAAADDRVSVHVDEDGTTHVTTRGGGSITIKPGEAWGTSGEVTVRPEGVKGSGLDRTVGTVQQLGTGGATGVGFPLGPGTYTVVGGTLEVTTARDTVTFGTKLGEQVTVQVDEDGTTYVGPIVIKPGEAWGTSGEMTVRPEGVKGSGLDRTVGTMQQFGTGGATGVGFPLGPGTYTVVDGILEVTTARDTATIGAAADDRVSVHVDEDGTTHVTTRGGGSITIKPGEEWGTSGTVTVRPEGVKGSGLDQTVGTVQQRGAGGVPRSPAISPDVAPEPVDRHYRGVDFPPRSAAVASEIVTAADLVVLLNTPLPEGVTTGVLRREGFLLTRGSPYTGLEEIAGQVAESPEHQQLLKKSNMTPSQFRNFVDQVARWRLVAKALDTRFGLSEYREYFTKFVAAMGIKAAERETSDSTEAVFAAAGDVIGKFLDTGGGLDLDDLAASRTSFPILGDQNQIVGVARFSPGSRAA